MPETLTKPSIEFLARDSEKAIDIPFSAATLAGFCTWAHSDEFPKTGKSLYCQGRVTIDMSPEDLEVHNKCKGALSFGWDRFLDMRPIGEQLYDGAMFVSEPADLAIEPDAMLCLYDSLKAGRVAYREASEGSERFVEVVGSPDIIAEVVSKSSVKKDTVNLLEAYFQAGVREYWLIDARKSEIDFRIYTPGDSAFQRQTEDESEFVLSNVLSAKFKMTRNRNPVGGWQYRLEFN